MQQAQSQKPFNTETQTLIYDPFKIPPNIKLARLHESAKKIGFIDFEKNYDSRQLCPCCNLPFEKRRISLLVSTERLGFLGTGYPLYFFSTKLYITLLMFIFALVGVYNIVTTARVCYQGDIDIFDRSESINGCYNFFGIMYTINKTDTQLTIQAVLDLIAVIMTCGGLYLIKYLQTRLNFNSDEDELTASDYTIMINHVNQFTTANDIKIYFQKNFKLTKTIDDNVLVTNPQIVRVIFASRIDEFVSWSKQKVILLTEQRKIFSNIQTIHDLRERDNKLQSIIREMAILNQKIKIYEEQTQLREDELRCPYVFVTFNTQEEMKAILQQNKESFFRKLFVSCCGCLDSLCFDKSSNHSKQYLNGSKIHIYKAPEPLDICWENLSVPHGEKQKRYFVSVVLSLLLIVAGAVILYLISLLQTEVRGGANQAGFFLNNFLSFLCALLIFVVNFLLCELIRYTSRFEKHSTHTKEIKSATLTLIIMQFINTALVPFALFIFKRDEFLQEDLMASLFFIFLGNVFIIPAYVIFDPLYLLRLRKKKLIVNQGHLTNLTQMDVHLLFQGPEYDIIDKQTTINQSILTCTFYACIFPYGSALEILALFVYYWASKYILLRRCSWPTNLSSLLQENIFRLMTIMPVTLAFGGLCYELVLIEKKNNLSLHIINIIIAGMGMMFIQLVKIDSNQFVKSRKQQQKSVNFQEQRLFCPVDYDRCNPVTRTKAIQDWQILWSQRENNSPVKSKVNWVPMVVNNNNQLPFGVKSPLDIQPQIRLAQVVPNINQSDQQLPQEEEDQSDINHVIQEADFHRNNMMCSSQFVQRQMKNRYNSP